MYVKKFLRRCYSPDLEYSDHLPVILEVEQMEKKMIYDIKDNKQLCGLGKEFFEKIEE